MDWMQIVIGPALMSIGGLIVWIIKAKIEELRAIEEKLGDDRRKVYEQILEPYIRIFTDLKGSGPEEAIQTIKSFDYRKAAFNLNLFGSDNVVTAYNELMQCFFKYETGQVSDPHDMLRKWGNFLLEIRKSLGNQSTRLKGIDMLKGMIKDVEKLES